MAISPSFPSPSLPPSPLLISLPPQSTIEDRLAMVKMVLNTFWGK